MWCRVAGKQNGKTLVEHAPAPVPVALGRPSAYTPELGRRICDRIADGVSVKDLCKDEDMPGLTGFYDWLRVYPEFSKLYARAKQIYGNGLAEELIDIADNGTNDWMQRNDPDNPGYDFNGEAVARTRIRLDTRKWIAGKLLPKIYGDRVFNEHTGENGGPIRFEMNPEQRAELTAKVLSVKKIAPKADT